MVIGAVLFLMLLTLWGWHLKTNQIEVFQAGEVKGKQGLQMNSPRAISNPENSKLDLSQSSAKDQPQQVKSVPTQQKESGSMKEAGNGQAGIQEKININFAGIEQLVTLNGIGEVKARAIIDHRERNGTFERIDQIQDVKGIGEATYNKIKDWITVSSESPE